jgi:myo-inositol 2-dehydrogenase / D-chiro-inositol 1-dehydrogenase
MNIGVIGTGLMGSTHVRILGSLVSGATVAAVSDPVSGERVAAEHGVGTVHADPLALIRDDGVDAVLIASPAGTHEALTLACLQEGKPVLCEKPLAAGAEGSARVVEAEAALGRRLVQVGFMRRYDAGYQELKRTLDEGAIGAPLLAHMVHRNATAPPHFDSPMMITDSVVHEIDVTRWLLGEEIVRATVFAPRASSRTKPGLQDPQLVLFETESGRLVDVECFVSAGYGYDIRCEVVGETGTLELAPPARVTARASAARGSVVDAGFWTRFAPAYQEELQRWVDAVSQGEPAGPTAWDGYAAAAVSEAAVAALREGRTVDVQLTERPGLYADRDLIAG